MLERISTLFLLFAAAASLKILPNESCSVFENTFSCLKATDKNLLKTPQPDVTRILLTQSTIPTLKKEFLINFPRLVDFEGNGSEIERIEENAFHDMGHLKWVSLSSNKLKKINPNIFQKCINLRWFNVSDNAQLVIPKNQSFLNAPLLEVLDLQRCNIDELGSLTFQNLTGLKFLSLAENNIKVLPYDVFKLLSNLEILDLSDNKMRTISLQVFADIRPLFLFLTGNPWECDCELYPVILWTESFLLKSEVVCAKPEKKKWGEVVLNCHEAAIEA